MLERGRAQKILLRIEDGATKYGASGTFAGLAMIISTIFFILGMIRFCLHGLEIETIRFFICAGLSLSFFLPAYICGKKH